MERDVALRCAPIDSVEYPVNVYHCGECSLPMEYCDWGPCPERCREWMRANMPELFAELCVQPASPEAAGCDVEEKKRQRRGGKAVTKVKKNAEAQSVVLSRAPRGKNKFVTVVSGLCSYGIDLKVASKFFSQKFACGSSVTGPDEIVIQGDVKDELVDLIPEKWAQIDPDSLDDIGDQKR